MKLARIMSNFAALTFFLVGCASTAEEDVASEEADLQAFRSTLEDRGALPLQAATIDYPEDARPFEEADLDLSQTVGGSKYVSYSFNAKAGDGLLLASRKTNHGMGSDCTAMVRLWLLDSDNRVVKTGNKICESEFEEPGMQSKSNILRHYLAKSGTYKVVVAVLPGKTASANDPVRSEPWKFVNLRMVRTHKVDQGALRARCQDGIDVFCSDSLRCERARCK